MSKPTFRLMSRLATIFVAAATLFPTQVQAQTPKVNTKFGNPTAEELNMTTYEADTDAAALVLYKRTDVYYDFGLDGLQLIYEYKVRLKILKPDGKEYGNVEFTYIDPGTATSQRETVSGLKATAYNMEGGKLVKTKMKDELVFKEKTGKDKVRLKFTVPQVKEGTVIEYQYKLTSDYYVDVDDWYAQQEIPVLYAQYELVIPEYFNFSVEATGMEPMDDKRESVNYTLHTSNSMLKCLATRYDFIARDLPALKDDDYVWHAADYSNKVTSELRSINIPGSMLKFYTHQWEDVDAQFLNDLDFTNRLKMRVKDEGLKITSTGSMEEKVAEAVGKLHSRVSWNGNYALLGNSASTVLKNGSGTNADMNFILMSMLQEAGVKCHPLVLRRRDTGRLPVTHPSIRSLNTSIIGIEDEDGTLWFYDCSSEDGCLNVISPNLLVEQARLIDKDGCRWANPSSKAVARNMIHTVVSVDADGKLTGKREVAYMGNASANARRAFRTAKDSADYVADLERKNEIQVDSYELEGQHDFAPKVVEHISFSKQADTSGDHIYLNPMVIPDAKESPFKSETRRLPVEFPYPQTVNANVSITIPEGWQVEELPKAVRAQTSDRGITLQMLTTASGQNVTLNYRFAIKKTFFGFDEYEELRSLADMVASANNAMLVLKKM